MVNTVCQKCDKTFKTPEGLDAHRQEAHTSFKCDICHRGLTSDVALRNHRNTHSSKERNHKCDVSRLVSNCTQMNIFFLFLDV